MDSLISMAIQIWETTPPTTWLLLLGVLISLNLLKKTLF